MKDKFFYLITFFVFLPAMFPLLQGWFPFFARTWFFLLVMLAAIFIFVQNGLKKNFILPLYFYFMVLFFNYMSGDLWYGSFIDVLVGFCSFLTPSITYYFYVNRSTFKQQNIYINAILCILLVTTFATYFVFKDNSSILREIQNDVSLGGFAGLRQFYNKLGVVSYEMGHSLCCLSPIVIFNIRSEEISIKYKIVNIVILIMICMLTYMSAATTPLLFLSILMVISFILPCNGLQKKVILRYVILLPIFYFVISYAIEYFLQLWISNSEGNAAAKAMEISAFLESGKRGALSEDREFLYMKSLEAFFTNPLLGVNGNKIGGHSILLDSLASLGLIGLIPLLIFLFRYYNFIKLSIVDKLHPFFLLSFAEIILMSLLKAISGFEYWTMLFLVMPLFYFNTSQRLKQY